MLVKLSLVPKAVDLLDRVRRNTAVNSIITNITRRTIPRGRIRDWCLDHLPRYGTVEIAIPYGAGTHRIKLQSGTDWLTSRIWWNGVEAFEPEVVRYFAALAPEARGVLDIGAYTGWYSVLAATLNAHANVLAFEPHPEIAATLQTNLDLNSLDNVSVIRCAAAESEGEAEFYIGSEGLPSSSSLEPEWEGYRTIIVDTRPVDDVVESAKLAHVDLVKIDIEGSEHRAIAGMKHTIRKHGPAIFFEALPAHRGTFAETLNFLTEQGYLTYECTPEMLISLNSPGPPVDALMAAESTNFLAVKEESRFIPLLMPYINQL